MNTKTASKQAPAPEFTAEDEQVLRSFLASAVNTTPDEQAPAPFIVEVIESDFNASAVKFLGKADIVNISPDVYLKLQVHIDSKQGEMFVTDGNQGIYTTPVSKQGELLIIHLTRLAYGASDKQGASAIANYRRITESKHELFAEVARDSAGLLTVNRLLQWNRTEKHFYASDLWGNEFLVDTDKQEFAKRINTFLRRCEANKNPRDERLTEDSKGKKIGIGAYGAYKKQQASK